MQPATKAAEPLSWREVANRPYFRLSLLLAIGLAVGWFLIASHIRNTTSAIVWADQEYIFTQMDSSLANPYEGPKYTYVPWGAVIVAPVALLPLEWSILTQMTLYFVLLTLLIFRFGGGWRIVLLVMTSAMAYDTSLEISLDWIVVIGLLVPPVLSGPFLLVKPQVASGAWFGFRWREILWGGVVALVVIALALVIWPNWPEGMLTAVMNNTLGEWGGRVNIALSSVLPLPFTWAVGLVLAWMSFRRKDIVLGVLAWQFFVPYTTFYSSLPVFALLAIRLPWVALAISIATWVPYSQVLLPFIF